MLDELSDIFARAALAPHDTAELPVALDKRCNLIDERRITEVMLVFFYERERCVRPPQAAAHLKQKEEDERYKQEVEQNRHDVFPAVAA